MARVSAEHARLTLLPSTTVQVADREHLHSFTPAVFLPALWLCPRTHANTRMQADSEFKFCWVPAHLAIANEKLPMTAARAELEA